MKNNILHLFSKADKVRAGYGLAFILLLGTLGYTTLKLNVFITQTEHVKSSNEMVLNLERLSGNMKDAETGFRGYLIMKDRKYLEPYLKNNTARADSFYRLILNYTKEDIVQQRRLGIVRQLVDRRYERISQGLILFEQNNFQMSDSLRLVLQKGKDVMDSIRTIVGQMQSTEHGVVNIMEVGMNDSARTIKGINIASLLVSVLLAFYAVISYTKENNARTRSDEVAETYRIKLEKQVEELRNANEELVTLRRDERFASTGRIARTIAHEVRNPLTNINLAVEQIKDELDTRYPDADSLLDMVTRNSARINQLVTELLNSTRFSELKFGKRSINELLDEALAMAQDRIELNHIKVIKNYSKDICDVDVDPDKIKIAFLNIIVNAIEAMEINQGILSIETSGKDGTCYVKITDNGHGMDEEGLQRLFEPYFTKKAKGNGLGMTNTQNIVLNHKGTINVESHPGKGTSFIIGLQFPDEQSGFTTLPAGPDLMK